MNRALLVGLDTSFLLRLLVFEPEAQAAVAELDRMRETGQRGAVSDLVAAETYFALQHHYEVPKQEALNRLRELLEAPEFTCMGEAASILRQPNLSRSKPGFVDRLIHAEYIKHTATMLSFEKAAKRLPGVRIPS